MAAHKYWRAIFPDVSTGRPSSTQELTGIDFRTSIGGSNVATGGSAFGFANTPVGTATISPDKLFDGSTATLWGDGNASNGRLWGAGYVFPSAVDIVEMVFYGTTTSTFSPPNIIVQFSDDGFAYESYFSTIGLSWATSEAKVLQITSNLGAQVLSTLRPSNNLAILGLGTFGDLNPLVKSGNALPNGKPLARLYGKGSNYKIEGTTTQLGIPLARTVWLVQQKSGLLIDTFDTDSSGAFSFQNIEAGTYSVIGVNDAGGQNSVIYAHVDAVAM